MMTSVLPALGAVEDASADRGTVNCLIDNPPHHGPSLGQLGVDCIA